MELARIHYSADTRLLSFESLGQRLLHYLPPKLFSADDLHRPVKSSLSHPTPPRLGPITTSDRGQVPVVLHFLLLLTSHAACNWASEASPTLGCSIEISGDIYMYVGMSVVCQINCVGGITWTKHAHAQSQVLGC